MANTKKEWSNMTIGEKLATIGIPIAAIAIALVATAFFYWIPQPCDIDKQYMYCCTHPTSGWDILGTILFWFGCVWLSGLWGFFVQDDDADPWATITKVAWGCAVGGLFMIVLL